MSSDTQENRLTAPSTPEQAILPNTPPLATTALLTQTLSFMTFRELSQMGRVAKSWKQVATILYKSNKLHTLFFTPDDVRALTKENDTNEDIFNILDDQLENRGFASRADLDTLSRTPKDVYLLYQSIEKRLEQNDLRPLQIFHLKSARVILAIMDGKLTIEDAINRSDVDEYMIGTSGAVVSLLPSQITGIRMGLIFEEVRGIGSDVYFSSDHLLCVLLDANLDQVIPMDIHQAKSLLNKKLSEDTEESQLLPAPIDPPLPISTQLSQFGTLGEKKGSNSRQTSKIEEDPANGCCIIS